MTACMTTTTVGGFSCHRLRHYFVSEVILKMRTVVKCLTVQQIIIFTSSTMPRGTKEKAKANKRTSSYELHLCEGVTAFVWQCVSFLVENKIYCSSYVYLPLQPPNFGIAAIQFWMFRFYERCNIKNLGYNVNSSLDKAPKIP